MFIFNIYKGEKYKGRGFIQLTGRSNYQKVGVYLRKNLIENPELAAFPSVSSEIARYYFEQMKKINLNTLADGTFYNYSMMTYLINGALTNMKDRVDLLEKFMNEFKCGRLLKGKGDACSIDGEKGYCKPICPKEIKGRKYCGCSGVTQDTGSCKNPLGGKAPSNIKCCVEKCSSEMDLTFLLDSSGSIDRGDFQKSLLFTENVVDGLKIGENETRVGIINFSSSVETVAYLNSYYEKSELIKTIRNIYKISSGTNTGDALKETKNIYDPQNGARNESQG
jgi:hypothetical protein